MSEGVLTLAKSSSRLSGSARPLPADPTRARSA